jgi:signal transduction histidine kinase
MLATIILVTGAIEAMGFLLIALHAHGKSPMFPDQTTQAIGIALVTAAPLCVLIAVVFLFAWLMGRKIGQPVNELMQAVEKIRRQDLNFNIQYRANNELGDLCGAFNEMRHELYESLEREWRQQDELRTQLAALSHDLRTPVTIIQGHIEGLARAEAGEKRSQRLERYLPVLAASSERMTRLLNDILLVASLEQTNLLMQPCPVRLEEALERKSRVYQLRAAEHEIAFSVIDQVYAKRPTFVCIDLHRVEQIFDNLFENALRYTPTQGQINLTYTYDGRILSWVLRDTGPGIAPRDLPHIFDKFYYGQTHPDEKTHKAAGLGLYICKLLVDKLDGTIAIRNHPDGGCEAIVRLPLAASE